MLENLILPQYKVYNVCNENSDLLNNKFWLIINMNLISHTINLIIWLITPKKPKDQNSTSRNVGLRAKFLI